MIILSSIINPNFFSAENISNVTRQISVTTILAFGETILIICGMLDLSCGSVLALSGLLSVASYKATGSMALAFAVAIGVAVALQLSQRDDGRAVQRPRLHCDACHAGNGARRRAPLHEGPEYLSDRRLYEDRTRLGRLHTDSPSLPRGALPGDLVHTQQYSVRSGPLCRLAGTRKRPRLPGST